MFGDKKKESSENQQQFTVFDTCRGKTFATEAEAKAYEREYRKRTGIFVSVERTQRKVTHKYGLAEK